MSTKTANLRINALYEFYFPVTDVSASTSWYASHLGMQVVSQGAARSTLRLEEGALLTLVASEQLNRYDSVPINMKAHDARTFHERLVRGGVRAKEPENWHHYVDFDVYDPDGNPFNVISEPAFRITPNNLFRIDGIFLGVADYDRALAWYSDILGADLEYVFTHPTESLLEARFACFRGVPFSLVESPVSQLNHRVCEFRTSDAAADHAFLRGKGVRVSDLQTGEGATAFAFYDMDGNEFGVVEFGDNAQF